MSFELNGRDRISLYLRCQAMQVSRSWSRVPDVPCTHLGRIHWRPDLFCSVLESPSVVRAH